AAVQFGSIDEQSHEVQIDEEILTPAVLRFQTRRDEQFPEFLFGLCQ
ncbi:unnamed protein product, partial [marine sediment metagenome]